MDLLTAQVDYLAIVRAAARRTCPALQDADIDEVIQRASLRLHQIIDSGRRVDNGAAYLYRMGANLALDLLRELERRQRLELQAAELTEPALDGVAGPEAEQSARELAQSIEQVLQTLPRRRAEVLRLHLMGYRPDEIADALDLSWLNTRNLLYRGLRQLKAGLRDRGYDHGRD
jgi:RNA polymerase sigma-70 factor (ECF subfamily)